MSWRARAACVGVPDDVFFPVEHRRSPVEARRICNACPVRAACLNEAMSVENDSMRGRFGVFGGLTPTQRARLARKARP